MKDIWRYILSTGLLLGMWKAVSVITGSTILPPPERAFHAFGEAVKSADFWVHFSTSAMRIVAAMAIAWMVAFPLGILMGYHRRVDRLLSPLVFLTYPIPKIVLLPLFLLLFGLGDLSKVLMVALITGYQILVATRDGVAGLEKKYFDSFASIGGCGSQAVRHVLVPAALPYGFTALRIGTGTAVAVLFFVESFATQKGLGFLIMDAWGRAAYENMFVGIIGMSLLGIVLYEFFNYLERNICAWKFIRSEKISAETKPLPSWLQKLDAFTRMIKFSHTVFALPFALAAVVLAQREYPLGWAKLFWILLAMVGARSAAMGFNRIVDARFDARNPRTSSRAIPSGEISTAAAVGFVILFSGLFVIAAGMISKTCLVLSGPVLLVLFLYSLTKRFTSLSHLFLGFAISLAPVGAWIAVTGGFDWAVLTLSTALLTYIAGFDILYACQDTTCDLKDGLFSIPAQLGVRTAFHIAALLHVCAFFCFFMVLIVFDLGWIYMLSLLLIGVFLVVEHRLIRPDDLSRINVAFFHMNSAISVLLFLGVLLDELARGAL